MEKSYLQINFVNWITVFLMASVGFFLFGAAASFVKSRMGGDDGN